MVKTIVLSGVNEVDVSTLNNRERYAWIKNNTGGNIYASALDASCTAGADNVAEIASGDVRLIDTLSMGRLYMSGNGSVEIELSDSMVCPFKLSQKGGDISASGSTVQLGGLQDGVPFSEIVVSGKNMFDTGSGVEVRCTAVVSGNTLTLTPTVLDGTASAYYYVPVPLKKGQTVTISGSFENSGGNTIQLGVLKAPELSTSFVKGEETTAASGNILLSYTPDNDYPTTALSLYARVNNGTSAGSVVYSNIQVEYNSEVTEYVPPITGQELTVTVNDTPYNVIPDSVPYTVPTEIYQQDGINTVYVTGEGEPTLSVKGIKTNAAVKRIWDKLNELTTAIIVSNTGFNV